MYSCLKGYRFLEQNSYTLLPIRMQDQEPIRKWRNAQLLVLRQNQPLTIAQQSHYFHTHLISSFAEEHPKQILCSFLKENRCIGYGGLTNINWHDKRAEVSFLLDPQRVANPSLYAEEFTCFLQLLCDLTFNYLCLHRLFTETFAFRTAHLAILEKFGFIQEGRLREHVYKNKEWTDCYLHGLLQKEWLACQL